MMGWHQGSQMQGKCSAPANSPPRHLLLSAWEARRWSGKQREISHSPKAEVSSLAGGRGCSNPQASKANRGLALTSTVHQARPSSLPDDIRDQLLSLAAQRRVEQAHAWYGVGIFCFGLSGLVHSMCKKQEIMTYHLKKKQACG